MALLYKLWQDNRSNSQRIGKWYARAVRTQTTDTEGLTGLIEKMCTATDADIYAVLKSLSTVIRMELLNGHAVRLDGLGTFSLGLKTKPADTAADFDVNKNVAGYRVNFLPESKGGNIKDSRKRHPLYDGVKVQEAPKNTVDTGTKKEETENGNE